MKLAIVGHFGGQETFSDGQTVKTIAVYEALSEQNINIKKIDTYYIHKNILKFIWPLLKSIFCCKKYIVLVSKNGRRILFPIFALMSRFLKKDIYHYAIGGRLAEEVKSGEQPLSRINSFRANWVESEIIVRKLRDLGITNAKYIPNFKNIVPLSEQELVTDFQEPYRFCTFSRVVKEKGITDAVNAIRNINKKYGKIIVKLDIYGSIENTYKTEFESLIGDDVQYCGVIQSNKSVEILKDYFILIFPTHYKHEGMPGTIIDALCAGVPIIARKWAYCDEMITDKLNGYVYDFNKPELLNEKIIYSISNVEQTILMRKNCIKCAEKYSKTKVVEQVRSEIGI